MMEACEMQLPERLICPIRDSVSPSHTLLYHIVLPVPVATRHAVLQKLSWDTVCMSCAASFYAVAGVNPRPAALGRSGMPCAECTMAIARMRSSQSPSQRHAGTGDRHDKMVSAGCHIDRLPRKETVGKPKVKRRTSRQVPTCTSARLLCSREASDDAQVFPRPASVTDRHMHQTS